MNVFHILTNLGKMRTIFGAYVSTWWILMYFQSYLGIFQLGNFLLQGFKCSQENIGHLILDIFSGASSKKSVLFKPNLMFDISFVWYEHNGKKKTVFGFCFVLLCF